MTYSTFEMHEKVRVKWQVAYVLFLARFSEKKRHLNEHGKRSPSWDCGQAKKRVRRDSQRDKSSTEEKKGKTPAELIAECEADIR